MRTPEFWYPARGKSAGCLPLLLAPLALCYAAPGRLRRFFVRPWKAAVPILSVGNLVAGGAGKTPVALALASRLLDKGVKVHFLTRGYGGRHEGPLRVEPNRHTAAETGDEALLLAAVAPTWVARNRKAGAMAAIAAGAELLILDDGHQNPHLVKDLSLLLIDAGRGHGNGWIIPSGPLREAPAHGLARADMVLMIGAGTFDPPPAKPYLRAARTLRDPHCVKGRRLLAFCGIGAPQQFFDMLLKGGAVLTGTRVFPDHHTFTDNEIGKILSLAAETDGAPVTTEKDWVRLPAARRRHVQPIGMEMHFSDEPALARLLDALTPRRP
ncbi:MAG: tetraacyldisaccharide 4'-kinase [Alphaproteobacteria bacterium]